MQQDETFVQIASESLDSFLFNVGPNKTLERGMRLTVVEGEPAFGRSPRSGPNKFEGERKSFSDKKSFGDRKPAWDKPARDAAPARERPARQEFAPSKRADPVAEEFGATNTKKKFGRKPEFASGGASDRGFSDRPGKDWAKPGKPSFANSGDAPPKRKKPKSNG
jgi:ATP-dependent RNA helicase DeaD